MALIIYYILSIITLFLILHLLWTLYFYKPKVSASSITAPAVAQAPIISQWHLFGIYQSLDEDALPRTQLPLNLQGIFYSDDPTQSQALIADIGGSAKVYNVGQSVMGATIKKILPYTIILEVDGSLQQLPLPKSQLDFAPPPQDLLQAH